MIVYVLGETDGSVYVFDYDAGTGQLKEKQTVSALPPDAAQKRPTIFFVLPKVELPRFGGRFTPCRLCSLRPRPPRAKRDDSGSGKKTSSAVVLARDDPPGAPADVISRNVDRRHRHCSSSLQFFGAGWHMSVFVIPENVHS